MADKVLTLRQQNAAEANGSVIVYAAAGSGKTAVLTERVVKKLIDEENPIEADKLLIVTFTNAAAAEMRTRISELLEKKAEENPSPHISRQLMLISAAPICTINSFCVGVVRENFEIARVNPNFKMATEFQSAAVSEAVIRGLLAEKGLSGDKNFKILTDSIGIDASLRGFSEVVLDIYNSSRSMPCPEKWLRESAEKYKGNNSFWYDKMFSIAAKTVENVLTEVDTATLYLKEFPDVFSVWSKLFEEFSASVAGLSKAVENKDYDKIREMLPTVSLSALGRKYSQKDEFLNDFYKSSRVRINGRLENLNKIFNLSKSEQDAVFEKESLLVDELVDFIIEYGKRFRAEMINKNLITFDMAEHLAYEIICKPDEDGNTHITEVGKILSEKYKEVLVDEYQDNNRLQDALFMAISDGGKHLFMVGDAKQSIYGFRHANPESFIRYRDEYPEYQEGSTRSKVVLDANFRSREAICDFTNLFFSMMLNKEVSEMDYTNDDKMTSLLDYKEFDEHSVEYHILEKNEKNAIEQEAEYIANYIKATMERDAFLGKVGDKPPRKARYGDFAILLRSTKNKGAYYLNALRKAGIPAQFNREENDVTAENLLITSLLQSVDNPTDGIALTAAATGPIFAISPEKIAQAKAEYKSESLYGSLCLAAEDGNTEIKRFVDEIKELRRKSAVMRLSDFVDYVFDKYSIIEIMSSADEGERRVENLKSFLAFVSEYESDDHSGLSSFLRILSNADKIPKTKNEGYSGDSVKIMTIHSAKGLQFPICILANCSGEFNKMDSRAKVKKHEKTGISVNITEPKTHTKIVPVSSYILADEINKSMIAEEQRLLYVAITRASEKIIFIISETPEVKKINNTQITLTEEKNKKFSPETITSAKSYSAWLMLAIYMAGYSDTHEDYVNLGLCSVSRVHNIESEEIHRQEKEKASPNPSEVQLLKEKFSFNYPYSDSYVSKTTVSEILADENYEYEFSLRPAILSAGGLSPAEKGTALHKFMQYADFNKAKEDAESEIGRLVEWEYISEAEADSLDREKIEVFLNSELCENIIASPFLLREQNFLIPLNDGGDTLVQGSVDCVYSDEKGIYIVDFKTTRYETEEEFIQKYRRQLEIYAEAMAEILGMEIAGKYIYSLHLGKVISL